MVFIADEVQTGFARTGAMFACEHEAPDLPRARPDLHGQGIADGLPLSAVTGRAEIMNAPHVGGLGGTFGGNRWPSGRAGHHRNHRKRRADRAPARSNACDRPVDDAAGRRDDRIGDVRGRGYDRRRAGQTEPLSPTPG